MFRWPPGHAAPQRKYLLALALILLPWLPLADAQQQHQRQPSPGQQLRSSPGNDQQHVASNLAATASTGRKNVDAPNVDTPRKAVVESSREVDDDEELRRRILSDLNTDQDEFVPNDARAHALAPDLSVRAPPPSHYRGPSPGAGLSQHIARSLEDWEVEDFVLLATVDGDLYASDRKTGQERWHFKTDQPMVETRHFRINNTEVDEDYDPIDHYIWVVEPTRDGELYLWRPNEHGVGLAKMALTMKKLVEELSPYKDPDNAVVYTGDKKTTMVTLNAATGTIIKQFGSAGSYVNKVESQSCFKPNALADSEEECGEAATITLGRTEYTVSIQRFDGSPIASLKYSEWGPNTRDSDLILQNSITKDSRYITGQHDGKVYGFEYGRFSDQRPVFAKTLSAPVARVFDVLHRWGSSARIDPELIVLPQPPLPASDEDNVRLRNEKVFINQTEEGSWYALSGSRYPLILSAPAAPIHRVDWFKIKDEWDQLPADQKHRALIGTHHLPDGLVPTRKAQHSSRLLLDAPPLGTEDQDDADTNQSVPAPQPEPSRILTTAKKVPEFVVTRVFDAVTNPAVIAILFAIVWWSNKNGLLNLNFDSAWRGRGYGSAPKHEFTSAAPVAGTQEPPITEMVEPKPEAAAPSASLVGDEPAQDPAQAALQEQPISPEPAVTSPTPLEQPPSPAEGVDAAAVGETPKKKKGHRGRRGGVKHRKGGKEKRENSQSRDDDGSQETVEEVVHKAKTLVREPKLEPDIITVPGGADDVSGHILKLGSLEVNEAEQLGTGSNGTIVFAGKFGGRDVAVKRMLVQFNEIAIRETKLLRESDDHENGKSTSASRLCATNRHSHSLLLSTRAQLIPVHCTRALPGIARRYRPEAALL